MKKKTMDRNEALDYISREIVPAITAHTVVLGRVPAEGGEGSVDWFCGSGILTKIESTSSFGILTAGHVVRALRQAHEARDPEEIALLARPGGGARGPGPLPLLRVHIPQGTITACGRSNTDAGGPDLAWIPLSIDVARAIEDYRESGAVFYNLEQGENEARVVAEAARNGEGPEPKVGSDWIAYAVGWNREKQAEAGGRDMTMWVCEAIPDTIERHEGWLYSDYVIQGNGWNHLLWDEQRAQQGDDVFEHPRDWGGISGGGMWHIFNSLPREKNQMVKQLAGIIFFDQPRDERRVLRAHVLLSIRRILNEARVDGNERMTPEQFHDLADGIAERVPAEGND